MDKLGEWLGKLGKLVYTRLDINASQKAEINAYVKNDVNDSFADINSSSNASSLAGATYKTSSPTQTQLTATQTVLTTMASLASIQNDIAIVSAYKWCQQDNNFSNTRGQTQAQKNFDDYLKLNIRKYHRIQ